jgi:hypothetical protein
LSRKKSDKGGSVTEAARFLTADDLCGQTIWECDIMLDQAIACEGKGRVILNGVDLDCNDFTISGDNKLGPDDGGSKRPDDIFGVILQNGAF